MPRKRFWSKYTKVNKSKEKLQPPYVPELKIRLPFGDSRDIDWIENNKHRPIPVWNRAIFGNRVDYSTSAARWALSFFRNVLFRITKPTVEMPHQTARLRNIFS